MQYYRAACVRTLVMYIAALALYVWHSPKRNSASSLPESCHSPRAFSLLRSCCLKMRPVYHRWSPLCDDAVCVLLRAWHIEDTYIHSTAHTTHTLIYIHTHTYHTYTHAHTCHRRSAFFDTSLRSSDGRDRKWVKREFAKWDEIIMLRDAYAHI